MKIFNLFLILNVVFCLGGICNAPLTFASATDDTTESCHSMNQHGDSNSETSNMNGDSDPRAEIESTCCNEYLSNNYSDLQANVSLSEVLRYSDLYISTKENSFNNNRSLREHDPPDLLVLNSTFLI